MALETKVRKVGNSLGIVLPKEVVSYLKVEEGAVLHLMEDAEGTLRLTADRPGFGAMIDIADRCMNKYRNLLRELAK